MTRVSLLFCQVPFDRLVVEDFDVVLGSRDAGTYRGNPRRLYGGVSTTLSSNVVQFLWNDLRSTGGVVEATDESL